jgi:hypothetical protein
MATILDGSMAPAAERMSDQRALKWRFGAPSSRWPDAAPAEVVGEPLEGSGFEDDPTEPCGAPGEDGSLSPDRA